MVLVGYALLPGKIVEMEILWKPEEGTCSSCRDGDGPVRMYSSGSYCQVVCFGCWNACQEGVVIGSRDWLEDTAFVFTYPGDCILTGTENETSVGTAQGFVLN